MSRWHRQLLAYSYCWVFLSFASVDDFALSCPLWRELLGKSKLRAMRTVLSLSWEEERWKCFKDHYSGAGKLLLGLKPLWMIAGATGFKIWMEKNRWVDWHLCTEWLAGKRDGWKYWFCLFSTRFRTDSSTPSLQSVVASHGGHILTPMPYKFTLSSSQGSQWPLPWKHRDCQKQSWHKKCLLPPALKKHVSHTLCSEKLMSSRCSPHSLSKSVSFSFTRWKKRSILRQLLSKGAQGLALFTECF